MKLRPSNAAPQSLDIQLFDEIDATNSSYTVLNSKVDVLLQKRNPGRRWAALESAAGGDGKAPRKKERDSEMLMHIDC